MLLKTSLAACPRVLRAVSLALLCFVAGVGSAREAAGQAPAAPTRLRIVGLGPVISAVSVSGLTASAASIHWTTDRLSNSRVEYGQAASYGSNATNATLVTSHTVVLAGLASSTVYYYRVHSEDAAGNPTTSAQFTFTTAAAPDTTRPTTAITAPGAGASVSGNVVVSATASDNVGVAGVQFKLDDANLGTEDTSAPYSVSWTTTAASNGSHALTAVARDAAGNTTTSTAVTVTVANDVTAPAISMVATASITSSSAAISWTTGEASTTQVDYGATTSYGSATAVNGTMVTAHAATITGLNAGTLYHFRVKSQDAAGNLATSGDFTFTTLAAVDATPPTVAVTAPGAGATISGAVSVSATANDNVGVAGVQFKLDGANLGTEDTSAPYSVSWNTGSAPNGTHALTAVARDAAGNTTTSVAISVTVSNTASTVLTLSPQDTSLKLDATNYSTGPMLTTYTWPAQQVANAILMKFDLSSLPAGVVVQNATLHLAVVESDAAAEATYAVAAHKVLGRNPAVGAVTGYTSDGSTPWTANPCCSNGVPMAQADISAAYGTQAVGKAGFNTWTITAMVEEWRQDPLSNFGLLLNADATAAADRYRFFASMDHADPALRPYLRVTYGVPPPDPTPPTVSIAAPAAGSTVSGTVTVMAAASDNVGVASVQFELDGASLGARDTTAPFSVAWNTTAAAPGTHTLRAIARDAAGNATTSASISVTIAPPPVSSSWPNEPAGFTVIEDTGWENGTLGSWYRIFTSADKPINVSNITGSPIGESKALQIDFVAGHQGGGGTELRYDIAAAERRNELYIGYYVQVNPQWQGHNSGINKMLYLHDGGGSFSAMWYEMFGSGGNPLDLYVVNQSGNSPAGFHENVNQVTFTRGQWYKVEIYQKQGASNNGIVRVWVNGVLAIDRADVNTRSTPIDNVTISGIWGGVGDSKNQADYMRFDRIRISRPGQ